MKDKIKAYPRTIFIFLGGAILLSLILAIFYVIAQQNLRQEANEPQLTIIEDTANIMSKGYPASVFSSSQPVDIAQSLDPFVIIYDAQGQPLAATGQLRNKIPTVPIGVLQYARDHQEDRVTWQPEPGVRIALVVKPFINSKDGRLAGFAAVGRSLWLVEMNESLLLRNIEVIWFFSLVIFLLYILTSEHAKPLDKK